jgi:hypothetical protein
VRTVDTDYLVVGAGAMGMAFTDALIDHADVHVTLVDRRDGAGGHWHDAYPFVQLHQASLFYGVASTVLGTGAVQRSGPEAGLHERAPRAEVAAYYDRLLRDRFAGSGRVTFLGQHQHRLDGDEHVVRSIASGQEERVRVRRRYVDATYLSPTVPATSPPPFAVGDGVRVVPVGALADLVDAPSTSVIVGSGKTATDAIVRLLDDGVDADRIVWVRPRDPWMLNRAVVQPDPVVAMGLVADTLAAADGAATLDEVFERLEDAGAMLRVDPEVRPTMAKTPTLGAWELDLLRTVGRVVRLGHLRAVERGRLVLDRGEVAVADDALIVHCAASGLRYPPIVPIWQPDAIRVQSSRAGFPCFNAALIGVVEATRDDDGERNRLCPANTFPDRLVQWAQMQVIGFQATAAFGAEADLAAWANACALNPARIRPEERDDPRLQAVIGRVGGHREAGLARLAELAQREG